MWVRRRLRVRQRGVRAVHAGAYDCSDIVSNGRAHLNADDGTNTRADIISNCSSITRADIRTEL